MLLPAAILALTLVALTALHALAYCVEYTAPVGYIVACGREYAGASTPYGRLNDDGQLLVTEPIKMLILTDVGQAIDVRPPPKWRPIIIRLSGLYVAATPEPIGYVPTASIETCRLADYIIEPRACGLLVETPTGLEGIPVDPRCVIDVTEPPYTRGILLTPTCRANIEPVETVDTPLGPAAVVFKTRIAGKTVTVILADNAPPELLERLGALTEVAPHDPSVHVYMVPAPLIPKIAEYRRDILIIDNYTLTGGPASPCTLPRNYRVVAAYTWRPFTGTEDTWLPLPGELIVVEADGEYYVCAGDMGYLATSHCDISYPVYAELGGTVRITCDGPAILATSDLRLPSIRVVNGYPVPAGYNATLTIDYGVVESQPVYIIYGSTIQRIAPAAPSILQSPIVLSIITIAVAVLIVKAFTVSFSRPQEVRIEAPEPERITPLPPTSPEVVAAADRFARLTGYYPEPSELVHLTGARLLVKPEPVYCGSRLVARLTPLRDKCLEELVSRLAKLLAAGYWDVTRATPRLIYAVKTTPTNTLVTIALIGEDEASLRKAARDLAETLDNTLARYKKPEIAAVLIVSPRAPQKLQRVSNIRTVLEKLGYTEPVKPHKVWEVVEVGGLNDLRRVVEALARATIRAYRHIRHTVAAATSAGGGSGDRDDNRAAGQSSGETSQDDTRA